MAAIDDIKTAELAIDKGIADVAAYLKTLATEVADGVAPADAAQLVVDLNAKAVALEALVPPAPPPTV